MKEYFIEDMSADFCAKSTEEFFDGDYIPSGRINKYPKPVIIWQSNSCVQAQNGIFSEKFLEEIYISPFAIEQIREELFTMGISMPKLYPELSKIFENYRYNR